MHDYFESPYYQPRDTKKVASIEGKGFVEYDACDDARDAYDEKHFRCIGHGTIYSIDGVLQRGTKEYYFFLRT